MIATMIATIFAIVITLAPPCITWCIFRYFDFDRRPSFWIAMCVLAIWSANVWGKFMLGVKDEPCDMVLNSEQYAQALRRLSDLKEVCGHMEGPERFKACTQNPALPQLLYQADGLICAAHKNSAIKLHVWVSVRSSDLYLACSKQDPCMRWAKTAKGWNGTPILN